MDEYAVDVLPGEVIPWARSAVRDRTPAFAVRAFKEYQVERDYDAAEYGIGEGEDLSLVTVTGSLTLSPTGEGQDWVLELRARDSVGLVSAGDERGLADEPEMTVEAFVQQFILPEKGEVEVILHAESPEAADAFQRSVIRQREASADRR